MDFLQKVHVWVVGAVTEETWGVGAVGCVGLAESIWLGGLGGGEAEDAVAGEDFVSLEPALRHLEGVNQIPEGALSRGFIQRFEFVDLADDAGGVDVGDGERD